MKKKVSIIVPVYNAAPYLDRCMESLLAQTYRPLEILLVDDGSTDGSGRICDAFEDKYNEVKVLHTKNSGVSSARNKGLEVCSGDYIAFVDADDYPLADMVEYLVFILEETGCDVAGCGYREFRQENQVHQWENGENWKDQEGREGLYGQVEGAPDSVKFPLEVLSGAEFIEKGILKSDTRCWSKLFRKESINGLRFEAGLTIGEDMLFLLKMAQAGNRFCRSEYKGYGYFINADGAMMRVFKDSYMDQILCWQRALEIIEKEMPGMVSMAESILLISAMLVVGKLALLSGKERERKKAYVEACIGLVKEYGSHKGAFGRLDRGYRIKVTVFRYAPWVYMMLYGVLCGVKRRISEKKGQAYA